MKSAAASGIDTDWNDGPMPAELLKSGCRVAAVVVLSLFCCVPGRATADDKVSFEAQIRPLLQQHCWDCHGSEQQEARLRLDRRSAVLRGGDSGEPALVPGDADASHLMQLVLGREAGKRMPPEPQPALTEAETALLRRWISEGAEWSGGAEPDEGEETAVKDHWSFQPVRRPPLPELRSDWPASGVDVYVLQGLQRQGLSPNPVATKRDQIRRLYLDMLGLLPEPQEVFEYERDERPEAWEQLVERVLSSSHYGERWARYWLDLVRFAETNGYETNRERPNAWPYRDYVIRSLNDDKPYDQFVREQLAGDALGAAEATAYLVAGPYDLVKSPDVNLTLMQRQNELDDMIGTTTTVFLGLTVGCARCHNHKFDPILQRDYYALQAVFAGVQHGDRQLPEKPETAEELGRLGVRIGEIQKVLQPWVRAGTVQREAVSVRGNEETFVPQRAKFLRWTITATNSGEPCVDELEVYSAGQNVALASLGVKVTASGTLPGYAIHQLQHLNDGVPGNARSWISNEAGRGWVMLEFPEVREISRIVWSRDREGRFQDRLATKYQFEVAERSGEWRVVASDADRVSAGASPAEPEYDFRAAGGSEREVLQRLLTELQSLRARRQQLQSPGTVYAGTFQQPGPTHRLFRGEPTAQREPVGPDTVAVLGSLGLAEQSSEQQRRVALANWIASSENPLTARVIVNRLWQFHFGRGLVSTPSDFGAAGARPTHPELLDWLSIELMENNWSLKHIHRLILCSQTYRQSSVPRADGMERDGGTEWLWRFPSRRLEAEPLRDCILQSAGVLRRDMYGPGFSAFQVELENVRHYFPKQQYGPEDWRRMIYQTKVRLERESVFGVFDCPDGATSVPRRSRSTTPLQALNLFNSSFMLQQSELLAERLQREGGAVVSEQIQLAFRICFGRAAAEDELRECAEFVQSEGLVAFCRAVLNSNELAFIP
ncbi:MAG: hypothetical protein RIT02_296 [Planctomycetota bacterium]